MKPKVAGQAKHAAEIRKPGPVKVRVYGHGFDVDKWNPLAKPKPRKRIPKNWTKVRVEYR